MNSAYNLLTCIYRETAYKGHTFRLSGFKLYILVWLYITLNSHKEDFSQIPLESRGLYQNLAMFWSLHMILSLICFDWNQTSSHILYLRFHLLCSKLLWEIYSGKWNQWQSTFIPHHYCIMCEYYFRSPWLWPGSNVSWKSVMMKKRGYEICL